MKALRDSVFLMITLIFSAILLVYSLMCTIRLARLSDAAGELEKELSVAEQENRRLTLEIESAVTLRELETYAVNVLGMQHARCGQIVYINLG